MVEIKVLYESNFEQLCRYSEYIVKRTDIAKDIVQDSFILFYKNIHNIKEDGNYINLIKKMVRNKSIDHYRKYISKRKEISIDDYNNRRVVQNIKSKEFEIVDIESGILQKLINSDCEEILNNAIDKLTPRYKQIYKMYEFDKMKHKDIAERLCISESTSKTNLRRARKKLKKILLDEDI